MPAPIRAYHDRRERGWARDADGLTTVNEALADRLATRWGRRPVVAPNYPEPREVPELQPGESGPLRRAIGVGVDAPGRPVPGPARPAARSRRGGGGRPGCARCRSSSCIGFGRGFDRATGPRRRATVRRPPPDAAPRSIRTSCLRGPATRTCRSSRSRPSRSTNGSRPRTSSWESLAAGTPVVVPAGLTLMAGLVRDGDLGVVADSASAADLGVGDPLGAGPARTQNPAGANGSGRRRRALLVADRRRGLPHARRRPHGGRTAMTDAGAAPDPGLSRPRSRCTSTTTRPSTRAFAARRATLAAAGYAVTVLATARSRETTTIEREAVDGYEIVRVPVPEDWHEEWRRVVSPCDAPAGVGRAAPAGGPRRPGALGRCPVGGRRHPVGYRAVGGASARPVRRPHPPPRRRESLAACGPAAGSSSGGCRSSPGPGPPPPRRQRHGSTTATT